MSDEKKIRQESETADLNTKLWNCLNQKTNSGTRPRKKLKQAPDPETDDSVLDLDLDGDWKFPDDLKIWDELEDDVDDLPDMEQTRGEDAGHSSSEADRGLKEGERESTGEDEQEPAAEDEQEPAAKGEQEPAVKGDQEPAAEGEQETTAENSQEPPADSGMSENHIEERKEEQGHHEHHHSKHSSGHHSGSRGGTLLSGSAGRGMKKKPVSRTALKVILVILCVFLILVMGLLGTYLYLTRKGEEQLKKNQAAEKITVPDNMDITTTEDGKTVVYDGKTYHYNEDNLTFLVMGVDTAIEETGLDSIGANGQADVLLLVVMDSKTGHVSLINISRDSMVDVNEYNVKGQFLRTEKMQICLAYAYGDGKDLSCQNTVESVSRLMYGMPINGYAAMDYSAINILNDAIGGVTVNVLEDLSANDPALIQGNTVTLQGTQAETYVRSRDTGILDSNNLRMQREEQYLNAFIQKAVSESKNNLTLPLTLYNSISDYTVTTLDTSQITYLASLVVKNGISEDAMTSVSGEVKQGDVYAEFYPDDEELYKLILSIFYKEATML